MTEFASIYDKFLSKIEDYGYAELTEEDANAHFYKYLTSAITKFKYVCRKDLENKTDTRFLDILSDEEQDILAKWMVVSHIEGNMVTEENMRNFLNSRDYKQYSSANLLKSMGEMHTTFYKEVQGAMSLYDTYQLREEIREKNGK